jgi:probable F420-dependent oxidoreductase
MASSLADVTPGLSIHLANFAAEDPGSWKPLLDRAVAADRAGIDRLSVSDHVVFGENLEAYARPEVGGIEGGKQPTGPDGHWLEPLTLLSVISALTSHTRLATGILIAALRRPVTLAKTVATLDVLSGGRVDLGVGVGWQREEYDAAGLRFEGRGRLLDHTLAVCQTLWLDSPARFADELLSFESIHMMPKPLQPGGVPIWVSGTLNERVVERVVRFGTGWIPWGPFVREPASGVTRMREALEAAGRDPKALQVQGTLPAVTGSDGALDLPRTLDGVPALVDAGVTDFRAYLPVPKDPNAATDYLAGVVAAFRETVGRSPHPAAS